MNDYDGITKRLEKSQARVKELEAELANRSVTLKLARTGRDNAIARVKELEELVRKLEVCQ